MNNLHKNKTERLKIFKGISVTCSTMIESQINKVSNMIVDMGGNFHVDFPKTTNVLVIDIQNLKNYESILNSMKYKYVTERKLDTVILDFETLKLIYSLYTANAINKIHPILSAGGSSANIKNDEFLKHIVLNLLRVKYTVKPFDLLKNKFKVFFGKFKHQEDVKKCVESIKQNISDKNFLKLDIKETCYMTQLNDEARDTCLFITELNYGARLEGAKKDRIPVIHIQWIKDILKRNMMLSYKPYLLNDITTKSASEINDKMMANRSWKNSELSIIEKDLELSKQIFDEYEVIDNKIIIKKNLKSKLDNTIWDKIMCNDHNNNSNSINNSNNNISGFNKGLNSADITKSTDQDNSIMKMKLDAPMREESILPPATQQDYFKDYHILTFGFSEKHNKVLERTFKKSQCITFRFCCDYDASEDIDNTINKEYNSVGLERMVDELSVTDYNFSNGEKILYVIPYNYDLSKLPNLLIKKYKETLEYLEDGNFDWNYSSSLVVTEFYLERCLFYKKLIKPDFWSIPFYNSELKLNHYKSNKLVQKDNYIWTTTGFEGVEFLHLNKIIKLLDDLKEQTNLTFSQNLNNKTDLLVVNLSKLMAMRATRNGPLYDEGNKYMSLFKEEERKLLFEKKLNGNDAIDPNNFLLKKLNFIRNSKNHIASVTPGFLFEIFHQFNIVKMIDEDIFDMKEKIIKVNDKVWCITCPQTSKRLLNEMNDGNGQLDDPYERYIFRIQNDNYNINKNSSLENRKRKLDENIIPELGPKKTTSRSFNRPESVDISPNNKSNQNSPEKDNVSDKWRSKFLNKSKVSPLKERKDRLQKSPLMIRNKTDGDILNERYDRDNGHINKGYSSPIKNISGREEFPPPSSQITYGFGKTGNSNKINHIETGSIRTRRKITRQATKDFTNSGNKSDL